MPENTMDIRDGAEQIQIIPVRTNPPYDVRIGPGLLDTCGEILTEILPGRHMAIIADSTVAPLYMDRVRMGLQRNHFTVSEYTFPAGEEHKNLETLSGILEFLAREGLTRTDCVIALGGGVTGDMAGFAAAVYLRGVRYVQFPTTLLAAVDSSVGGKTAVDLRHGKNLAGAFAQPAAVLCDTDCLRTLPPDVFADGAAEAVKTGILSDETLFMRFETGQLTVRPADVIAQCVAYKAGVVERDERERNERRLLNLGHTIGHAVEKCSGYVIPHGHAVAVGLAVIARAAAQYGWTELSTAKRICACLRANQLPVGTDFTVEELTAAALSDKKRAGDQITLVIPVQIGHCELKTLDIGELNGIIRAGLETDS